MPILDEKHSLIYYINGRVKTWIWLVKCDECNTIYTKTKGKRKSPILCRECAGHLNTFKHGKSKSRAYNIHSSMKKRCENPNAKQYEDYGGRGITISQEFQCFEVWESAINKLPNAWSKGYSIDRIDNDKGYEQGNLRWATALEQNNNRRPRRGKRK